MNVNAKLTTGTQKQIAYGENLRSDMMYDIQLFIDNMHTRSTLERPDQVQIVEQLELYIETELNKISDSVWWIEKVKKESAQQIIKPIYTKFRAELTQNLPKQK